MDVAVVGGSAWFVGALRSIFQGNGRFRLAAEVGDVPALLRSVDGAAPIVVILACESRENDLGLLNQQTRRNGLSLRPVVKLPQLRPDLVRDAMQGGAWGCFSADDAPEAVLSVLSSVADGRASYPFVDFSILKDDPFEQLTLREKDVLRALAQGWSNTQISARLGISENTVKYHLKLIYGKLGVASRSHAIAQFLQRTQGAA